MEETKTTVRVSIDIARAPTAVFDVFIEELALALVQGGMGFEAEANGHVTEDEREVGRVVAWKPGELIRLQCHQADWQPEEVTDLEGRCEAVDGGARVTLEHRGWGA